MMKKLLSIATLLLVSMPAVLAQNFEFRYHGESLADGATVTIAAQEDEWGFGELWCYTNPSSDANNGLVLKLLSGNQATVSTATLTINENTMNPSGLSWCMGDRCMYFGDKTSLTKENFIVDDGSENVQFDAENIQSEGHLLATLTATIGSETHTVKIKFTNGEQQNDPIPGDVNGDGNVTAADVTALYNFLLNDDDGSIVNGDVNGDGSITSGDITFVYNILLGSR